MANHVGSEGHVSIGANVIAELRGWSISESANVFDASTINSDWKNKKTGQKEWSGSLDCWWDETDTTGQGALTVGAEITLNVYPEGEVTGDTYLTGSAYVTSIERSTSTDSMVEASFSFEGNGALTEATVA